MNDRDLATRLEAVERRYRRLLGAVTLLGVGGVVAVATGFSAQDPGVVRATEVVIEDPDGVVRARLGGDLPDAVYDGRTVDRGTGAAGLLIYDSTGGERGGYVTFDNGNALLTLDAGRAGEYGQTAYFVADESGATALRVWNGEGDHVELRSGETGAHFNAVEDGVLTIQLPEMSAEAMAPMCTELTALVEKHGHEPVMGACRQRMTEDRCTRCLGGG